MKKILDYLKLSVFVLGVLVGVQIPGFIDQYGKNLDARVSESGNSIGEFQDDADNYFGGDISRLIEYYSSNIDPVITSGGESIEAIFNRNQLLINAQQQFNQSVFSSYTHVLISPVEEIRNEVWTNYTYNIVLNGEAILLSISVALLALALFELTIFLLGTALHIINPATKKISNNSSIS